VASFFAVEEQPSKDGAIFAITPGVMNERLSGERVLYAPAHSAPASLIKEVLIHPGRHRDYAVAFVRDEMDIRMLMQGSVFTIHGSNKPLEDLLDDSSPKALLKFSVPEGAKSELRRDLDLMGVFRSSLFPDLENLARDIVRRDWDG